MKLYIKNMKCVRCKLLVKSELEKLGLHDIRITAGEVEITGDFPEQMLQQLRQVLCDLGMELTDDKDTILIEKIKVAINEMIYDSSDRLITNFSDHISARFGHNYKYLSGKFRIFMGTSIKKYFIRQRTDHVKELLRFENLSLSQIAFKLHYSSVAHLSSQFKKETGQTLSNFRMTIDKRISIMD
jgi:AraC-like DNA-binding protein